MIIVLHDLTNQSVVTHCRGAALLRTGRWGRQRHLKAKMGKTEPCRFRFLMAFTYMCYDILPIVFYLLLFSCPTFHSSVVLKLF